MRASFITGFTCCQFATGLASVAPEAPRLAAVTKVVPSQNWGEWFGWGTSLAWWANVYGQNDSLADLFFTLQTMSFHNASLPGLGLNIERYNVGGSSWTPAGGASMVASPNIPHWKQISGFWLDWNSSDPHSDSFDWSVDANQRAMLLKAVERGASAELFSNSPIWWQCDNHNPSGSPGGNTDNLQSWNYQQHAFYIAETAAQYAIRYNVSFYSVDPFNEPTRDWWKADGTQEGCHFGTSTQAAVIGYLAQELEKRNLSHTPLLAASDENTYDLALSSLKEWGADAAEKVDKINTHGYQYGGGRRYQRRFHCFQASLL